MPVEPIIEPNLPIIDAHHHLWFFQPKALGSIEKGDSVAARTLVPIYGRHARYLLDEFMTDITTGHNIRATVYVEAHAMYRAGGAEEMKSVGEIEFANGVAATAASGLFGESKICAGIVGNIDLRLGDAVERIIEAHLIAANGRYRGVRTSGITYDADSSILGAGINRPHALLDKRFRAGFRWLHTFGLSFDTWLFEPQLSDLVDLARSFPETQIALNHMGTPLGVGRYAGRREERFPIWRDQIRLLSQCDNVSVKLGGLGIPFGGFSSFQSTPPATCSQLASEWRPYIETCIEAFGVHRCMFESNYPVDSATCTYPVLWNTFKTVVAGASNAEKEALFSGTAQRFYRLDI